MRFDDPIERNQERIETALLPRKPMVLKTQLVREVPENEESTPIHVLYTTDEDGFSQAVARLKIVPDDQKQEQVKLPYIENVLKPVSHTVFRRSPRQVDTKATDLSLDTLCLDGKLSK